MSYAITQSAVDAAALVAVIDAHVGYPEPGTVTHAVVEAHPQGGQWAVALDGLDVNAGWLASELDGLEVVERLPSDWRPGGYS